MRISVAGATGRTGVPLVEQALAAGHEVRVLVRDADKAARLLPGGSDHLEVVVGDLMDASAVERLATGADVVLDLSGPVKGEADDMRSRAAGVLLRAMAAAGVRRLITLTGAGVQAAGDQPKLADKVVRFALKTLQGDVLASAEEYVAAVTAADVDWTVVRGPRLHDKEARGRERTTVVATVGSESGTQVARADLATVILEMAEQGTFVRQMPVVSW